MNIINTGRNETGALHENIKRIKLILAEIEAPAYIADARGQTVYINPAFESLAAITAKKAAGSPFAELLTEDFRDKAATSHNSALKGRTSRYSFNLPSSKNKSYRCTTACFSADNKKWIVGIAKSGAANSEENAELTRLKSELKLLKQDFTSQSLSLKENEEKYYKLLDIAGDAIILTSIASGIILFANKKAELLIGRPLETIVGRKRSLLHPSEERRFYDELIKTSGAAPELCRNRIFETNILGKDGALVPVSVRCDVSEIDGHKILQCVLKDLTEAKKAELESRKFKCATGSCSNSVAALSKDGTIEYVNQAYAGAWGLTQNEAIGRTLAETGLDSMSGGEFEKIVDTIASGAIWRGTIKGRRKDGVVQSCNAHFTPIIDQSGAVTNIILAHEDPSGARMQVEQMRYLAHFDKVTGLFNRGRFIELLSEELSSGKPGSLLLLDLDHFKLINDSHGHGKGDEFLSSVAMVLRTTLKFLEAKEQTGERAHNLLGRLSGDEFAVYLPALTKARGFNAAEEFRKTLEGFYSPDLNGNVTASIGISVYPEHGGSAAELLTNADAAMYRAKDDGRNRSHVFEQEDRHIEGMQSKLSMKNDIITALKGSNFNPWFQPILNIKNNTVDHYEALARMKCPKNGIVLPALVIDVAERFGLVGSIDKMIIEKSLRLHKDITRSNPNLKFCMNLSGKNVGDTEFLANIESIIETTDVAPGNVVFEITETAAVSDLSKAVRFVNELKSIGCRISIDDFGIGFTSFLYLREMKADYIKIAGSFIKDLDQNLNDRLFVKSISDVAKGMDIKIIAEFVEKQETLSILRDFGVDYAQGYLVGKPAERIM